MWATCPATTRATECCARRSSSRWSTSTALTLTLTRTLTLTLTPTLTLTLTLTLTKVLSAFGSIPNLSLCVEHGHDFRLGDGEWQQLVPDMDDSWREVAGQIMEVYCGRTHGAYVQTKGDRTVLH